MSTGWRPSAESNVARTVGFCSRCACDLGAADRACPCCGADTVDANLVTLLKRTSARRTRHRGEGDGPDDILFPL
jgi:hypothetical protein